MSVTGLSLQHVGERFQHANDTISLHYKTILFKLSGSEFYNRYVRMPLPDDALSDFILSNSKFYPFFKDALGAVDGTHITCIPSADQRDLARNRK
ncbi:hypothetical protein EV360DRAFT_24453, partial [Lentinula raphanica]